MTSTAFITLLVAMVTASSVHAAPTIATAPRTAAYGAVYARPERLTVVHQPSPSAQYHAQDELGQYTYGYSSADGQAKTEIKGIDGSIAGKYSYIDANGKRVEVSYVADKDGFRAVGDHLPKGVPSMPADLARAYEEANERLAVAHSQVKEKEESEKAEGNKKKTKKAKDEEEEEQDEGQRVEEEEEEEGEEEWEEEEGGGKSEEENGKDKKAEAQPAPHPVAPPAHAPSPVAIPLHQQSYVLGVTADGRYAVAPVTFAVAGHHQKYPQQVHGAFVAPQAMVAAYAPAAHYRLPQPQQLAISQPVHYRPKSHKG